MTVPARDEEHDHSPNDQHRLRLVSCEACAEKEKQLHFIGVDLENLEADLKAKNRTIGKLKRELENERRESPHHVEAHAIFEYWRKRCRPSARTFGEDRLKAVLGRLNEKKKVPGQKRKEPAYDARYICEAIVGASIDPSVDKHGVPWNDLELICRDSSHLNRFHDLYKAWKWPAVPFLEREAAYAAWVEAGRP